MHLGMHYAFVFYVWLFFNFDHRVYPNAVLVFKIDLEILTTLWDGACVRTVLLFLVAKLLIFFKRSAAYSYLTEICINYGAFFVAGVSVDGYISVGNGIAYFCSIYCKFNARSIVLKCDLVISL